MSLAQFEVQFKEYADEFNRCLDKFISEFDKCRPQILADSLKYSLQIGGKRLRPVLTLAAADAVGVERSKVYGFALAVELIHTYSLIHDDLPEMDDDDFRRGKPSNHKVFGTANAVLAGDGLLNTAYSVLLNECKKGSEYVSAAQFICECAGINGMIAGQSADLLNENNENCGEEELSFIYENKTAKMITAPLVVPAILCGGKLFYELRAFGQNVGNLFQLTDDILDVEGNFYDLGKSTGKDRAEGKCTAVSLYGADGAKRKASALAAECLKIADGIEDDGGFMHGLVNFVLTRKN